MQLRDHHRSNANSILFSFCYCQEFRLQTTFLSSSLKLKPSLGYFCAVAARTSICRTLSSPSPQMPPPCSGACAQVLTAVITASPPFYLGGEMSAGEHEVPPPGHAALQQSMDRPLSAAPDTPESLPYKDHFVCGSHSCPVYIKRN